MRVFEVTVTGTEDLRRVSRQLRTVGNRQAVRQELVAGLRAGARPAQQAVKMSALALPDKGGVDTGLKRRIAAATGTQVRTGGRAAGVRVRVSRARMGDQAALPAGFNKRGYVKHPVFGNRQVWARTVGQRGWFDRPVEASAPAVRRELGRVLDRIEQRLAHP